MTRRGLLGTAAALAFSDVAVGQEDFTKLPANLPIPMDDGACDHLLQRRVPAIRLAATTGGSVSLLAAKAERTIVYCYPRTGEPGKPSPDGWDAIPGARGCTPQSCSMRDNYHSIRRLGGEVFGLSTQTTAYQQEAATRLHLPFALLSDANLDMTHALKLPTFQVQGWTLIKRLTLVIHQGRIEKVFYPIFPPDKHGEQVVAWLEKKNKGLI
jgi:peroxiredoxin